MAEQYNPEILQKYADILYTRARSLAAWTALRYGVVFGVISWLAIAIVSVRMRIDSTTANTGMLIAGFIGLLLGYNSGKIKAFSFVLQAQQVLCQRQIELNTRPTDAALAISKKG